MQWEHVAKVNLNVAGAGQAREVAQLTSLADYESVMLTFPDYDQKEFPPVIYQKGIQI